MKIDIKTAMVLGTLLFGIAGFYYTTNDNIYALSLKMKGVSVENHDIRKRLDSLDQKISKLNKQIKQLKKQK